MSIETIAKPAAEQVIIFDTTLRDGEQSPGISLNTEEKLEIAEQLARLGVDYLEAGFPVASQGDFEAVRAIASSVRGPTITGLSRTALRDIDRCWEAVEPADSNRIHVFIATSETHMKHKLKMTPDQVKRETAKAVAHARRYTADVEFSPEDASRSDFDFMCEVLRVAVDSGATTLNIPDTVGYGIPEEYSARLAKIREVVAGEYIISTHCHDDLGLAVANSLAAVKAGARQVEVAVNGIGERAGNAALEEVVMAIRTRSDYFELPDGTPLDTNVRSEELVKTSRLVSRLTGYPVQYNKAVVGRNAFAHEAGIHQDGMGKDRRTYEIMDPESVGSVSSIELGKHSGKAGFSTHLETLRIKANNIQEITDACVKITEEGRGSMSDVELERIALELSGSERPVDKVIILGEPHFETTGGVSTVELTILTPGSSVMVLKGENGGLVGAAENALQKHFPGYKMLGLDEAKSTEEKTASGGGSWSSRVKIPTGEEISTYAEDDNNIVMAGVKALVAAINCGIRIEQRKNK
jgi:2-isopropylmalate synthase